MSENQLKSHIGLEKQIEYQTTNLLKKDFHKHLGDRPGRFVERFSGLLSAVASANPSESDVSVLVVVPEAMISLEDQLALSGYRAFLRSSEMRNHARPNLDFDPEVPYALLDVSLGKDLSHLSADKAATEIRALGRTGLRLIELVSLGVHRPSAFEDVRGLYAVDTEHELDGVATVVDFYRYGDSLKVKRDPGHINDPEWTTPSFGALVAVH